MALSGDVAKARIVDTLVVPEKRRDKGVTMARTGYRDDLDPTIEFQGDDPGAVVGLIIAPNGDEKLYKLDLSPATVAQLIATAKVLKRRKRRTAEEIAADENADDSDNGEDEDEDEDETPAKPSRARK